MADWIFEGNPRYSDLDASVAASREHWWGTPRYRDRMAVGDRVWLQVVGPKAPGIYYVATIMSETYEHPVQPADPARFRWRTDIRFDYRIRPPLLRSELLEDGQLGIVPSVPGLPGFERAGAAGRRRGLGGAGRPASRAAGYLTAAALAAGH